ncbi:hypothetical protein O181_003730 [Austropuccinia psidii MF-1]|uniref:Uncharacterized protein n=1 Tax=Austropuccinia psidii MF-1 TaxID=1389203 RepID=A0A9Q3BEZ7_9BASI|nr:hypothetical protein [Austropuccinia psidii MF-1]
MVGIVFPPYYQHLRTLSSAYDRFMQEPYWAANRSSHLHHNGSSFAEWVGGINRVLCIAFNLETWWTTFPLHLKTALHKRTEQYPIS